MSRAPRSATATAAAPAPPASARRPRSSQTEKAKQKSAAALGAASRARGKRYKKVNANCLAKMQAATKDEGMRRRSSIGYLRSMAYRLGTGGWRNVPLPAKTTSRSSAAA